MSRSRMHSVLWLEIACFGSRAEQIVSGEAEFGMSSELILVGPRRSQLVRSGIHLGLDPDALMSACGASAVGDDDPALRINAVNLEYRLGDVETRGENYFISKG